MAAESKHKQIADAVAEGIVDLNLDGITETEVHVYWGADIEAGSLPAVFVCPIGTKTFRPATNKSDYKGYPISIFLVDRIDVREQGKIDTALAQREAIETAFLHQRLESVGVHNCELDSAPIIDPEFLKRYSLLAQPIRLRCETREARG